MSLLTVPSSFITEFLRWLVKERGYVSHHEIMEKLNVGYLTARKLLEPLERSGDIVCVGDTCFDSSSVLVLDLRFNRGFAALRKEYWDALRDGAYIGYIPDRKICVLVSVYSSQRAPDRYRFFYLRGMRNVSGDLKVIVFLRNAPTWCRETALSRGEEENERIEDVA